MVHNDDLDQNETYGLRAWVDRISERKLPAITATTAKLEAIAGKDTSSIGQIAQVLMHDAALTAQVLKVANSATYNPTGRDINTLKGAAITIGLRPLRSICVTAKLLSDLLKTGVLSESVHQRLMRLIADSLHAAIQARSLVADSDEDTRERVFIATLLTDIGETAFWSIGGQETEDLDQLLSESDTPSGEVIENFLGTKFEALSVGLVETWQLGPTLIDTIKGTDAEKPEVWAVRAGRQISHALIESGWHSDETHQLVSDLAKRFHTSTAEIRGRVRSNLKECEKLAAIYGAASLKKFLPEITEPVPKRMPAENAPGSEWTTKPDQAVQLRVLRDLAEMTGEKPDFNRIVQAAMEGIHEGIGMDRTLTALFTPDRKKVMARFAKGSGADQWKDEFQFDIGARDSLLTHVLNTDAPLWFDPSHAQSTWRLVDKAMRRYCASCGFMVAPLRVARRPLGFVYCDRVPSKREIKADDFAVFSHMVKQIGLCLSRLN